MHIKVVKSEKHSRLGQRFRKRTKVGEYTQMGFSFVVYYSPKMNPLEHKHFDHIISLIESKGFVCGGGGNEKVRKLSFFVNASKGTISEEQKTLFLEEVKKLEDVEVVINMNLVNVWNTRNIDKYFDEMMKKELELEHASKNYYTIT